LVWFRGYESALHILGWRISGWVTFTAQVAVESLSFIRQDEQLILNFVVDAEAKQLYRIESLLWKLYGMLSIQCQSDAANTWPPGGQAKSLAPGEPLSRTGVSLRSLLPTKLRRC
jgi:hypothetical protein